MPTLSPSTAAPRRIRALIAEDEPILATMLTQALQRLWPQLDIVATCANGVEALQQGLALTPEVLFLDIKMPGKSGLQAAEELAHSWPDLQPFPQIVFVTAYDEYALAAFEQAAADYVPKPISDARLGKTVERLRQRLDVPALPHVPQPGPPQAGDALHPPPANRLGMSQADITGQRALSSPSDNVDAMLAHAPDRLALLLGTLQSMLPASERLTIIRAAVGNQVRMIPIGEVIYFEALDKYVNVVTADSEALIRTSLKELLPQLDSRQFWQVHRGTIVNADCIASAVRDEAGKLSLNLRARKEQLRVSPLYAHRFRQM